MLTGHFRLCLPLVSAVLGIGCLLQISGCSRGEDLPPTYPTSGTVLYKEKPVEGATVVFRSTLGEKTFIATGVTDAQGNFQLTSFGDKSGAVAGTHSVTVTKLKSDQVETRALSMEEAAEQKPNPEPKVTSELPEKYSDPNKSDLKAEVKAEGPNEIKLDLKD